MKTFKYKGYDANKLRQLYVWGNEKVNQFQVKGEFKKVKREYF